MSYSIRQCGDKMRKYETPDLKFEDKATFESILDGEFDDSIAALNNILCHKIEENYMMESESIKFAKNFVIAL